MESEASRRLTLPNYLGGLTWRPLRPDDLSLWHQLVSGIQDHDAQRERQTRADLGNILQSPTADLEGSSVVGLDTGGAARAWARNFPRRGQNNEVLIHLTGGIDPAWRGRGIGNRLLRWQIEHATKLADRIRLQAKTDDEAPPDVRMGRFVEEQVAGANDLFRAAGFMPTRWFTELRRPLSRGGEQPRLQLPASLSLRPYESDLADRCAVAFNAAFAGQWGQRIHTAQSWADDVHSDAAFKPDLSFEVVDLAAAGEPVVGLVVNMEYEEDWPAQGYTGGYTEYVAVVPACQGRGLATQMLQLTAERFAERNHPFATLAVDADNPTSAKALYERLGYQPHHVTVYYAREA